MLAGCSWAQLRIDIHPATGRASDQLQEMQRIVQVAQQAALRNANAPEESAVVEAIVNTYRQTFVPVIDAMPEITTLTEKGSDILVARWAHVGQDASLDLIVWDTPVNRSYIFKLPAHSWSSEPEIRATLEKLALPRTNGATLNLARDAVTKQWFGTGSLLITRPPFQFDVGSLNWIDLWETTGASYLCVSFSGFVAYGPPNMRWIPERFPPLETRVPQWTKQKMIDELSLISDSDTAIPRQLVQWNRQEARDRALARELMRREVGEGELRTLLEVRRSGSRENGEVLQAVVDSGRTAQFSNAIRDYLRGDPGEGNTMQLERPAFEIVTRTKDANFTDAALEVLRRKANASGAFTYVIEHGETPDDYRFLAGLSRRYPEEAALRRMRSRLKLDANGDPLK